MTEDAGGFQFTADRPKPGDGIRVVRIPANLNRKRRVLAEYARQLSFPAYFGWNWDAFEECLRDLSWLDDAPDVIIVHRDVPFANSPEQQRTYLSILRDCVRQRGLKFTVIFPPGTRNVVNTIMNDE